MVDYNDLKIGRTPLGETGTIAPTPTGSTPVLGDIADSTGMSGGGYKVAPAKPKETMNVSRAAEAGLEGLKGLAYGAGAVASDLVGAEETKQNFIDKLHKSDEKSQKLTEGLIMSWDQVKDAPDTMNAIGSFIVNNVANQAPNMVATIASAVFTGGLGSALAKAGASGVAASAGLLAKKQTQTAIQNYITNNAYKGVAKLSVEQAAEKALAENAFKSFYANVGGLAASYGMGVGDIANSSLEASDGANIASSDALIKAIPYAALDFILPQRIISKIFGAGKGMPLTNALKEGMIGFGIEGAGETGQEAILMQQESKLGKTPSEADATNRLATSFLAGGLLGGAAGAMGGALEGAKAEKEPETFNPITNKPFVSNEMKGSFKVIEDLIVQREAARDQGLATTNIDKEIDTIKKSLQDKFLTEKVDANGKPTGAVKGTDKVEAQHVIDYVTSTIDRFDTSRTAKEVRETPVGPSIDTISPESLELVSKKEKGKVYLNTQLQDGSPLAFHPRTVSKTDLTGKKTSTQYQDVYTRDADGSLVQLGTIETKGKDNKQLLEEGVRMAVAHRSNAPVTPVAPTAPAAPVEVPAAPTKGKKGKAKAAPKATTTITPSEIKKAGTTVKTANVAKEQQVADTEKKAVIKEVLANPAAPEAQVEQVAQEAAANPTPVGEAPVAAPVENKLATRYPAAAKMAYESSFKTSDEKVATTAKESGYEVKATGDGKYEISKGTAGSPASSTENQQGVQTPSTPDQVTQEVAPKETSAEKIRTGSKKFDLEKAQKEVEAEATAKAAEIKATPIVAPEKLQATIEEEDRKQAALETSIEEYINLREEVIAYKRNLETFGASSASVGGGNAFYDSFPISGEEKLFSEMTREEQANLILDTGERIEVIQEEGAPTETTRETTVEYDSTNKLYKTILVEEAQLVDTVEENGIFVKKYAPAPDESVADYVIVKGLMGKDAIHVTKTEAKIKADKARETELKAIEKVERERVAAEKAVTKEATRVAREQAKAEVAAAKEAKKTEKVKAPRKATKKAKVNQDQGVTATQETAVAIEPSVTANDIEEFKKDAQARIKVLRAQFDALKKEYKDSGIDTTREIRTELWDQMQKIASMMLHPEAALAMLRHNKATLNDFFATETDKEILKDGIAFSKPMDGSSAANQEFQQFLDSKYKLVKGALDKILSSIPEGFKNKITIKIYRNPSEVPNVRVKYSAMDVGGIVNGFFLRPGHRGLDNPNVAEIYVFTDYHTNPTDAIGTLYHEFVGHYGMREMWGTAWKQFMRKIYSNPAMATKIYEKTRYTWQHIEKNNPLEDGGTAIKINLEKGGVHYISEEAMQGFTDEYVAELARSLSTENKPEEISRIMKILRPIINFIKNMIRMNSGFQLNDNHILWVLRDSKRMLFAEGTNWSRDPDFEMGLTTDYLQGVSEGTILYSKDRIAAEARNPDKETSIPRGSSIRQHLSENLTDESLVVWNRIKELVKDVDTTQVYPGVVVDEIAAEALNSGAIGVTLFDTNASDPQAIYLREDAGSITALHEYIHAATMSAIRNPMNKNKVADLERFIKNLKFAFSTFNGVYPVPLEHRDSLAFYKKVVDNTDELMAYAFSSPSFRKLLSNIDANGEWRAVNFQRKDFDESAKMINKNLGYKKQSVPAYPERTMWHELVDFIRKLFGMSEKYRPVFEQALEARNAAVLNNEKAATYAPQTAYEMLDSYMESLLASEERVREGGFDDISFSVAMEDPEVQARENHNTPESSIKAVNEILKTDFTDANVNTKSKLWRGFQESIRQKPWVAKFFSMGALKNERLYNVLSSRAQGEIQRTEMLTRKISKIFKGANLNRLQKLEILNYIEDAAGDLEALNVPDNIKQIVKESKDTIMELGAKLSELGMLDDAVYQENKGAYLRKRYIKYILGNAGGGKKPSSMDFLKQSVPAEDREVLDKVLGRIRDPQFLLEETLATIGRDTALINFFKNIDEANKVDELGWILGDEGFIDVNGTKVSIDWLEKAIHTQELIIADIKSDKSLTLGGDKELLDAENLLTQYKTAMEGAKAGIKGNYRQMPDARKFGMLRNKWVRNEIYSDLVDVIRMFTPEEEKGSVRAFFKPGGKLEELHMKWKGIKVPLNPPAWIRNAVSNLILMDISTNTNIGKLTYWCTDEIMQAARGNPSEYWTLAQEQGLFGTTFSSQEIYKLQRTSMDRLEKLWREQELKGATKIAKDSLVGAMSTLNEFLSAAGELYGQSEGWFKAVKMRDYLETWNKTHGQDWRTLTGAEREALVGRAAEEANRTLFDYSKIPGWLREIRRYPLGAPFITFTYKAFPAMMEGMVTHPQKFIKYLALPYLMMQAFLFANDDMDEDDYKNAVAKLPHYMKDKGSVFIMPFKDAQGRMQAMDFGYYLPWAPYVDWSIWQHNHWMDTGVEAGINNTGGAVVYNFAKGAAKLVTTDMGFLGGPVPGMVSALTTGVDPFLGKEIINSGKLPSEQLIELTTYIATMWTPSMIGPTGPMSDILDKMGIAVPGISEGGMEDSFGKDKLTGGQIAAKFLGANVKGYDPNQQAAKNQKLMKMEEQKIIKARNEMLRGPGSPQEKAEKLRGYNEMLKMHRNSYK